MGDAFLPACLLIRVGQTVKWVGDADKHVPTQGTSDGPFAVKTGTATYWQITFTESGVFAYYDKNSPSARGEIRVEP